MISTPIALDLPLKTDAYGVIRVGETRVTLHSLVTLYKQGESPEDLHEGFPTVPLKDIYAVIAYYLANRATVDAYLRAIDDAAEQRRREDEARHPQPTRAALQARLDARKRGE
jgi:uncharacterized protein (DUF433 family)